MNKNKNYTFVTAVVIVLVVALLLVWGDSTNREESQVPSIEEKDTVVEDKKDSGNPYESLIGEKVSPGAAAARIYLAHALAVAVSDVKVIRDEPKEWPDACLGVSTPDTLCAQVITSGYEVVLEVRGVEYTYRSNANGSVVKRII
jgi:hypothetical protein